MEPTAPLAAELLDICLQLVVHRYITTGNYFGTQLTPFCLSEPQSPPMRDLSTKDQSARYDILVNSFLPSRTFWVRICSG